MRSTEDSSREPLGCDKVFRQAIIGSEANAVRMNLLVSAASEQNNGIWQLAALGMQLLKKPKAIHSRQHLIEHDTVESLLAAQAQTLLSCVYFRHGKRMRVVLQIQAAESAITRTVIDKKN